MALQIGVNQITFEVPYTSQFADVLVNSGTNTPSISDEVQAELKIGVNMINLETPLAGANLTVESLTCEQLAIHSLLEEISGSPVAPEPEQERVTGGGALVDGLIYVGGPKKVREFLETTAYAYHDISEQVLVSEILETYAQNVQSLDTTIRKPIYRRAREVEILPYVLAQDKRMHIAKPPQINPVKKEEEELLLLGII